MASSLLNEILRRRAAAGMRPPDVPSAPPALAMPETADQLYARQMQPSKPPSFVDRLRSGLVVPDAPTHYKNRGSQNFLRGLVQGFKGDQGGGRMGG